MKIIGTIFKYLLILGLILLIISPIYFLVIISLFSNFQATSPNQNLYPDGFNIDNFVSVIQQDPRFYPALGGTILFAFLASLLKTIILVFGGFGLSQLSQKGRYGLILVFMFFLSIPEIILYTGLYRNTIAGNLKESVIFLPLSAPLIFSFFSLIYFQNAFLSIGTRFSKMIKIDHLNFSERVLYMYLPKLKIPLVISLIFSLIAAGNSYLWPNIILSGTDIILLGQGFNTTGAIPNGQLENLVAAGALITMIIPLILYWAFSQWVNRNFFRPAIQ